MIRSAIPITVVAVLFVGAACGGGDDSATGHASASSSPSATASDTAAGGRAPDSGKDACAALPRAAIQEVVGADPGEGELEAAASSTICRYYGDAVVTVEIDPSSVVAEARASIEAYGDTCESIDDIGDEALFCTGDVGPRGPTGQVVWTDGQRTYYVIRSFGEATPSKEATLELAARLQA